MSKGEKTKQKLATRDGGARCRYCGARKKIYEMTIDHVMPRSRGGSNGMKNLVLACEPCNRAKGNLPPGEFVAVAS